MTTPKNPAAVAFARRAVNAMLVKNDARIVVSCKGTKTYVSESEIPNEFTLRAFALSYAKKHKSDGVIRAEIEDLSDGEKHTFTFDGDDFRWSV